MVAESRSLVDICVGVKLKKIESGVEPSEIIVIEIFSPPRIF